MKPPKKHWLDSTQNVESAGKTPQKKVAAHRGPTWIYPAALIAVAGLLAVFAYGFRDRWLPATGAEVATAVGIPPTAGSAPAANDETGPPVLLFQATGWTEPDPLPIRATALYSGVVRTVHVLEGQSVTNGQSIVTLVDDDAQLAVRRAAAKLAEAEATRDSLKAELDVIRVRHEKARQLQDGEEARLELESDQLRRLNGLTTGAVAEQERIRAELQERHQAAATAAAAATVAEWKAEAARVEKRIEVQAQLIEATRVGLDQASLDLSRTVIRSPVDGKVLRLLATSGKRLMLNMDHPDSASAAILYDPEHLQARIDVPLADAGRLVVGQQAKITCSLLPDHPFDGTVTRIVGEADLQRNTLQVKVRIHAPDPRLRPGMLCRAEFFGRPASTAPSGATASSTLRVFIPESSVFGIANNEGQVWKLGENRQRVRRQTVRLGPERRDGRIGIVDGLLPGDRVILHPPATLEDGDRVRVISIDPPKPRTP